MSEIEQARISTEEIEALRMAVIERLSDVEGTEWRRLSQQFSIRTRT